MEFIKTDLLKFSKGIKARVYSIAFILIGFVLVFFNLGNFIKFEFSWILGIMVLPIILNFEKTRAANFQLVILIFTLLI
ncbi:MAG: hypothetical protein KTR26_13125, partial [Flammeovirgaceae bacterium]|nr:hypothetical protein [Flammeovirgaceae bacterium]